MTVSFVGAQGAAATTVTIPAHQVGDLILIFAYRDGSNTVPTAPTAGGTVPTWTQIGSSGGNTNSSRLHYATATATNTTSGTWTSATELICLVYRGASIGASAGGSGSATTSIAYPALTLQRTNNTSWVVGVAGHRTATNVEVAPTGMTNRASSGTEAAGHDTNGTVTSWIQRTVTVNASSAYRSWTVELKDKTVSLLAEAGSFNDTFISATLSRGRLLAADNGAFTHTGQAAGVNHAAIVKADVRAFTLTGIAAGPLHAVRLLADKGSYTETGRAAGFFKGYRVTGNTGLFNDNGVAATIRQTVILVAASGARTLTGNQAGVNRGRNLTAAPTSFVVSGKDATISRSGSKALTADKGTYLCTTVSIPIRKAFTLIAGTGSFTSNPTAAGIRHTARLVGATTSLSISGNSAGLRKGFSFGVSNGAYLASGKAASLSKAYRISAASYGAQINGVDSTRKVARVLLSSAGAFIYAGLESSRIRNRPLLSSAGTFATTGQSATFRKTLILRASGELVQYAGDQVQFVIRPPAKEIKTYAGGLLNIDQFYKARRIRQRFGLSGRR